MDNQEKKPTKFTPFHLPVDDSVPASQDDNAATTLTTLESEIKFYLGQVTKNIIEIGQRLIQAKSLVAHGHWQTWLENNFSLKERSARNFMQVAERFANRQTSADLNASQMTELLRLPAEDTETFIAEKAAEGTPVPAMSIKTLRYEIKLWKDKKNLSISDPDKITVPNDDSSSLQSEPAPSDDSDSSEQETFVDSQEYDDNDYNQEAIEYNLKLIEPVYAFFKTVYTFLKTPNLKEILDVYADYEAKGLSHDYNALLKLVDIVQEAYMKINPENLKGGIDYNELT